MWSKVTPRKVGFGLKLSGVLRIEREGLRRDWKGSRLKKDDSLLRGLRGRHHLEDHSTYLLRAAWTVEVAHSTLREKAQMARSSAWRET